MSHYPEKWSTKNTKPKHGKTPTHLMILPPNSHKHTIQTAIGKRFSVFKNFARPERSDEYVESKMAPMTLLQARMRYVYPGVLWRWVHWPDRDHARSSSQNNTSLPTRRPLYVICILLPDTTKTDYILINIFISFQIQIVRLRFISMTLNYTINTIRCDHSLCIPVCVASLKSLAMYSEFKLWF